MLGNLRDPDVAVHIGQSLEDSDWPKARLDLAERGTGKIASGPEELLSILRDMGTDLAFFKTLPAYQQALDSGDYPWLDVL